MNEAYIGLVGVAVGGFIAIAKDLFASLFKQRKNAEYLAIQIVCILDEFVDKCYEIVLDDGTCQGQPAGRHYYDKDHYDEFYMPQVDMPKSIEFPTDVDWKSIDHKIMYRILMLPSSIRSTNQTIYSSSEYSFDPDNEPVFEARQDGYSKLGQEAANIAIELRKTYNLPKREIEFYNPQIKFEETITKFERKNGNG